MIRRILLMTFLALPLLAQQQPRNEFSLGIDYEEFPNASWTQTHADLKLGFVIVRASHAERGNADDEQFEIEAYPKLSPKTYAYLAAGASTDHTLYPEWRAAAEVFHGFGKGWEASLGYRRLEFDDSVDLYTASLGKYAGNWLFIGRLYATNEDESWQAQARRYFGDNGTYLAIRYGLARDEIRSDADVEAFDTSELAGELRYLSNAHWTVNARAGIARLGDGNDLIAGAALGWRF